MLLQNYKLTKNFLTFCFMIFFLHIISSWFGFKIVEQIARTYAISALEWSFWRALSITLAKTIEEFLSLGFIFLNRPSKQSLTSGFLFHFATSDGPAFVFIGGKRDLNIEKIASLDFEDNVPLTERTCFVNYEES